MTVKDYNSIKLNSTESISESRRLLQKMSNNWHKRAQVKRDKNEIVESEFIFDKNRDDFLIDLLPFKNHPDFLKCSSEIKQRILSLGWLMYNKKTVDIEAKIVTPSCNDILYGDIPGLDDQGSQQVISEVMVDEAYHILLVVKACRITCEERDLSHIRFPTFDLVSNLHREKERCLDTWKKSLLQLATSVVSEVFISDYLDLLCHNNDIQPLNTLTVKTHRADELAHHSIFKSLAKCMYHNLNKDHQEFFSQSLLKPLHWFASQELISWQSVLQQIGFANWERMTQDCIATSECNLMKVDYSGLVKLAEELEIKDFSKKLGEYQS